MRRRLAAVIVVALIVGAAFVFGPGVIRSGGESKGSISRPQAELGLSLQESEILSASSSAGAYSLTLSYIAWTRSKAAGAIPRSEIREHLVDLSNELADQCSLCSDALDRELER